MLAFISDLLNKFIWRIRPIEETRSVSEIGSEQVHRLPQSQANLCEIDSEQVPVSYTHLTLPTSLVV